MSELQAHHCMTL